MLKTINALIKLQSYDQALQIINKVLKHHKSDEIVML